LKIDGKNMAAPNGNGKCETISRHLTLGEEKGSALSEPSQSKAGLESWQRDIRRRSRQSDGRRREMPLMDTEEIRAQPQLDDLSRRFLRASSR
jgi:hypothetical protein